MANPAAYQISAVGLPDAGGPLLLIRRNGSLRFFTHASRPAPAVGDVVLAYAPRDTLCVTGWQTFEQAPSPEDHVP